MKKIYSIPASSSFFKSIVKSFSALLLVTLAYNLSFGQCTHFYDGFESGSYSPTWNVGTALTSSDVSTSNVAQGSYSLTGTGGTSSSHLTGFSTSIPAVSPTEVSWYMYTNTTTSSVSYTVMGDNAVNATNCVFFSYWRGSSSEIRFVSSTNMEYSATPNTWYFIELKNIDWTAKTFDIHINGNLISTAFPFRSTSQNEITQIHLYNYDNNTGYWDDVTIGAFSDVIAPVADIANLPDVEGECEVTSLSAPVATDNCDGSVTGVHNASLPITSNTSVTWTYEDAAGNQSTQTQEVIIEDITGPVPDLASLPDIEEECQVINLTPPTATDNCDGVITATHNSTLPITSNETVIWTFEDVSGNQSTQTQEVVVQGVNVGISVNEPMLVAENNNTGVQYQWITCEGDLIKNAISQMFIPEANGSYAVIVTEGNCTDTSECATINTVGLTENHANSVNLYPNPTTGIFQVESDLIGSIYIIVDAQGRKIREGIIDASNVTINLSNQQSGLYYIKLEHLNLKVVKN